MFTSHDCNILADLLCLILHLCTTQSYSLSLGPEISKMSKIPKNAQKHPMLTYVSVRMYSDGVDSALCENKSFTEMGFLKAALWLKLW